MLTIVNLVEALQMFIVIVFHLLITLENFYN